MGSCYSAQDYLLDQSSRALPAMDRLRQLTRGLSNDADATDLKIGYIVNNAVKHGRIKQSVAPVFEIFLQLYFQFFNDHHLASDANLYGMCRIIQSFPIPYTFERENGLVNYPQTPFEQHRMTSVVWCMDVVQCFHELGLSFQDPIIGFNMDYLTGPNILYSPYYVSMIHHLQHIWPEMYFAMLQHSSVIASAELLNDLSDDATDDPGLVTDVTHVTKVTHARENLTETGPARQYKLARFRIVMQKMFATQHGLALLHHNLNLVLHWSLYDPIKFRILVQLDGPFARRVHWHDLVYLITILDALDDRENVRRLFWPHIERSMIMRKRFLTWLERSLTACRLRCAGLVVHCYLPDFLWNSLPRP